MFRSIRRFFRNLWRCFEYSRLVFSTGDFDFDWFGLVKLMEFKLIKMGGELGSGQGRNSVKIAKQLLQRILKDDYNAMYWNYHEEKFKIDERGRVNTDGVFEPKENLPQVFKFGSEPSSQQSDLEYFCKIMNKHLLRWWD